MSQKDISTVEKEGEIEINVAGETITLTSDDVEITSEDIPGWLVATENAITVALDITISEDLRFEGIARELVNRIQNIRKESDFDVTDQVHVQIENNELIAEAIEKHGNYISAQTLAESIDLTDKIENGNARKIELDDEIILRISVTKSSN
jgi:isoleucyl-tRNA synthetase